ncbi:Bug family tripartite tricarboxylate transporter substrate binding protein [Paralimibaculum aggregatum]|nr:tripartite tricarboxylate transporter substrate binding protein [Limibaculum sp. NKW23]
MKRTLGAFLLGISACLGAIAPAPAQAESFPEKPITLYVAYRAGGGTDTMGRVAAKIMGDHLGQQVNVVNKPGAGGGLAALTLMRERPDGYTILLDSSEPLTLGPFLNKELRYELDDFDYIGMLASYQPGLISPINRDYDTLEEFLVHAKEVPGQKFAFFSAGAKMVMQYIALQEGLEFRYVPTKGGSDAVNLIISDQVDVTWSGGIHARYPDQVKLIAAATSERHAGSPDVPTFIESGVPLSTNTSMVFMAPKGTPPEILAILEEAVKAATEHPDLKKLSAKIQVPISYMSASDTREELDRQLANYQKMIDAVGIETQ